MSDILLAPLEWHNEQRMVSDLVPYDFNPRKITLEKMEKLKASLEKFNLAEVPAINTDNVIIAGHQRIKVLMALDRGDDLIDVRVPNRTLTEKEYKEYNIVSNVSTGYWDMDVLEEMFADIDLEALGLNFDEIVIPEDVIPEEFRSEDEENFEPEIPDEPISKIDDVYELISTDKNILHRVVCGDSVEISTFEKLLKGEKIDCVVTDPPYNVDYTGGPNQERAAIKNDKMDSKSFYTFLLMFYVNCFQFMKDGASIYVFHADTEGLNFRSAFKDAGLKLSQCLVWVKNQFMMGRNDYHWQHEPCLYGWKPGAAHNWNSDRAQSTVLEFDKPRVSEEHPTMKPLPMMGYLICNSSQKGQIVFDGFAGSGSTLISCEKNWRNARVIEFDPKFVDVIVVRWIKYMRDNRRKFHLIKNGQELTKDDINKYFAE